jgi:hypothetical protein
MIKIVYNGQTRILSHKEELSYKRRQYAHLLSQHMTSLQDYVRTVKTMKELRRIKKILDKIDPWEELYQTK